MIPERYERPAHILLVIALVVLDYWVNGALAVAELVVALAALWLLIRVIERIWRPSQLIVPVTLAIMFVAIGVWNRT